MIRRIISGGQTGADQAALDAAMKFNIDCGGWIPKGRKTENGPLSHKYPMNEMETESYPARTRRNIMDSDGTVVIARGELTGGSLLTGTIANQSGKPCCRVDLLTVDAFEAAVVLNAFVVENAIEVLNVAGPRLSSDAAIYRDVRAVLEAFIYMRTLDDTGELNRIEFAQPKKQPALLPARIDDAVSIITYQLDLKTKSYIANLPDDRIVLLYFDMADHIREVTGLYTAETKLAEACNPSDRITFPQTEDIVMEIVKRVKKKLEKDHILRIVT